MCPVTLWLYCSVQAQVEGQLLLHLGHTRGIPDSRQTTRAITESILESTESTKVILFDVLKLLGLTKTNNYDRRQSRYRSIFFFQCAASHLYDMHIPFRGRVYMLSNAKHLEREYVWYREKCLNGKIRQHRCNEVAVTWDCH